MKKVINKYYFNFGNFWSCNINFLDFYRIFISLIFKYYNNFLYWISRFRYILEVKNYNKWYSFLLRIFNFKRFWNEFYIRWRFQIYRFQVYAKIIHQMDIKLFEDIKSLTFRTHKNQKIPFWFLFDLYIKGFVYLLLKFYFTESIFIFWWLYIILKFNCLFLLYLYIKYFIYIKLNYFAVLFVKIINSFSFFFKLKRMYYFCKEFILNNFYICYNLKWYLIILYELNIKLLIKFLYLQYKYNIIFKLLNISFTLNYLIFVKDYFFNKINFIYKLIKIFRLFFNYKNGNIYYKMNYYYFRRQQNHLYKSVWKRNLQYGFNHVLTLHRIDSFYHLTKNFYFYKNLYFFTLNTWINLYQKINLNLNLNYFFLGLFNSFVFFKYKSFINNIVFYYILLYFIIWIFLYVFYNSFFNLFFFNKVILINFENKISKLKNNNYINLLNFKIFKFKVKMKKVNFLKYLNYINIWYIKYFLLNFNMLNYFNIINKISFKFSKKLYLYKYLLLLYRFKNLKKNLNLGVIDNFKNKKIFNTLNLNYNFIIFLFKIKKFWNIFNIHFFKKFGYHNQNFFYIHNFFNRSTLPICFSYWIVFLPFLCIEYFLWKLNMSGHLKFKRRLIILIKVFLDNFNIYIKIVKFMGDDSIYAEFKMKELRDIENTELPVRRRRLVIHSFFKRDRFRKFYTRISSLGSYYYWFFKLNKKKYYLDFYKYFFLFIILSNYYIYIFIIYIISLILLLFFFKKINKNIN